MKSERTDKIKEKVARLLLDIHAVSLNPKKPFRYASGILSPVYTDCRILISKPKERKIIRDLYVNALKATGVAFDVIAGTATAGIPHAAWIAEKLNVPMIYVRGKAKDHGKGNQIEGILTNKQNVAVIEDLISTGESSAATVRAIRDKGGKASYIYSIITYGMRKSKESLRNNNINLISLTDFATVVKTAEKSGYIQKNQREIVLEWINNPVSWGKKMGFE